MIHRSLIVLGTGALAALYACTEGTLGSEEQAVMAGSGSGSGGSGGGSSGSGSGSGSGPGPQLRFAVYHTASNMLDVSAVHARLDLLLADDLGGLGALGYGGCAFDPAMSWRTAYTISVPINYSGEGSYGSFDTTLAQGYGWAQIVCTSGPNPPPNTGPGSDTSSEGPTMPPIFDLPPIP